MSSNPFSKSKHTPKKNINNSYLEKLCGGGGFQVDGISGKWRGTPVDMEARHKAKQEAILGVRVNRVANFGNKNNNKHYIDVPPVFGFSKRNFRNGKKSTIIAGTVFGNYCHVKQLPEKSKPIELLATVNSRIVKMYESLLIEVGVKDKLFTTYLRTGCDEALNELKEKYPK